MEKEDAARDAAWGGLCHPILLKTGTIRVKWLRRAAVPGEFA
jgi:hypothetical protein